MDIQTELIIVVRCLIRVFSDINRIVTFAQYYRIRIGLD